LGLFKVTIIRIEVDKPVNTDLGTANELFELLTKATRDAVWNWNLETDTVWWNEGYSILFGHETPPAEVGPESWSDYVHPEDKDRILNGIHHVIDHGGTNWSDEYRFRRADGTYAMIYDRGYIMQRDGKAIRMVGSMQDITERVALQKAREKVEERFRNMIAQAPIAISILSGESLVIETANRSMLELWGKDTSIIGLPFIEALPEIREQGFAELLKTVYDTGVSHYGFETLARLQRNGQLEDAYFNFVYAPVRDDGEKISNVMVLATEVTSQVKAKMALEESEQRFRNLISEAPAAISLFTGPEMIVELPNDAMLKFWGKGDTVTGKPLREAVPELVGQPFLKILDEVYTTGIEHASQEAEAELVVDGKPGIYYFNFTYKPLRNADGTIYAILDVAIDVTEQVMTRRKVEASELRFRTLLEAISPMTWTNTPEGEVNFYNQQWYNYTGLDYEQTKAWGWQAVVHPDDLPYTLETYLKSLKSGDIFVVENRYRRGSDGMYRWHLNRALPIRDETGNITLWVGTATDIHEQKRIEAELERQVQARTRELKESNQDLLRSNENLTRFAYVASHDLQEPLRKIQSFGSLLQSQYATGLGENGMDMINRMQSSAGRMSELIKDLLAYSRISTRQQAFDPVSLADIVARVLETLELQIHQTGALIRVDDLPTVNGDDSQLGQLFQNLLSNAIKFRHPDLAPQIQISYAVVPASGLPQNVRTTREASRYHLFSVTDNGIGFDEKYADRIFEVFQRLHGRSVYSGTGVGLAICQKVVENHGGAISAHSQPGAGSTFKVYLPV
jgi:PAS domain S-box-containing protein